MSSYYDLWLLKMFSPVQLISDMEKQLRFNSQVFFPTSDSACVWSRVNVQLVVGERNLLAVSSKWRHIKAVTLNNELPRGPFA